MVSVERNFEEDFFVEGESGEEGRTEKMLGKEKKKEWN